MPTSASEPDLLLDTSAAIALAVADHPHHETVLNRLDALRLGLAGHAAFETFSVLTRLPPPARLTPSAAARAIDANFPQSRFLDPDTAADLLGSLASEGIAGGAVYDALVGAAARQHRLPLGTRDRRAAKTYATLGVDFELLEGADAK